VIDLKARFGRKYRVTLDESWEPTGVAEDKLWHYRIEGRFGHLYVHGPGTIGVYVRGNRKIKKIEAVPGLKIHQRGDDEATYLLPPELLDAVAVEMKAKKRRQLTPEQSAALVAAGARTVFSKSRGLDPENGSNFDDD
jgi:hypothetical protein